MIENSNSKRAAWTLIAAYLLCGRHVTWRKNIRYRSTQRTAASTTQAGSTSQFVPFLLYLLLSAILKLTLCLLTILSPRYTHPRASDSPCKVWRVTNCDLYLYCIEALIRHCFTYALSTSLVYRRSNFSVMRCCNSTVRIYS